MIDNVTLLMTKIRGSVPVSADRTVGLDEPAASNTFEKRAEYCARRSLRAFHCGRQSSNLGVQSVEGSLLDNLIAGLSIKVSEYTVNEALWNIFGTNVFGFDPEK